MHSKRLAPAMRIGVRRVCQGYVLVRAKSASGARDAYYCAGDAYGVPLVHELFALGARDANWHYIITSLY